MSNLDRKLLLTWLKLTYQSMLLTKNSENFKEEITTQHQNHSYNLFHSIKLYWKIKKDKSTDK